MLFVPAVTDSALRFIGIVHGETAGGIHVPHRVRIEIRLLVIGFETHVCNDRVVFDFRKERIEDGI